MNRECGTCDYFSDEVKPFGFDGICKFDSNHDKPVMRTGYSANYKFKNMEVSKNE